jgi:hypothetical protein
VSPSEKPFYEAAKRYNPTWKIQHVTSDVETVKGGTIIVGHNALKKPPLMPARIVTSSTITDADRFYVYKKSNE